MNPSMLCGSIILGGMVTAFGWYVGLWPIALGGIIGGGLGCLLSFRD